MNKTLNSLDPLNRFTGRVENYEKYRPSYPTELIDHLQKHAGLKPGAEVADIGSGTGIFTGLLLRAGARVTAVEPNAAMRRAAIARLGGQQGFVSLDGSGEQTHLPAQSADLVTCAQAFHWVDPEKAAVEFRRVLRPEGKVARSGTFRTSIPLSCKVTNSSKRNSGPTTTRSGM